MYTFVSYKPNFIEYFSNYQNISQSNIYYNSLTSPLIYNPLSPINENNIFFIPNGGALSFSNYQSSLQINTLSNNINIFSTLNYLQLSSSNNINLYMLQINNFFNDIIYTSQPITFNNTQDIVNFQFLCYVSEDANISEIEQYIINNQDNLISNDYIMKSLTPREFGSYNLVGFSGKPNSTQGRLVIKIKKQNNSSNTLHGNIIITTPFVYQSNSYVSTPGYIPFVPSQIQLPMFNLQESLQLNNTNIFTLLFTFVPLSQQFILQSSNIDINLCSFGAKDPAMNVAIVDVYTQQSNLNFSIRLQSQISARGNFVNINENRNVSLFVSYKDYNTSETNLSSQQTLISVQDFFYKPHLQCISVNNNVCDFYVLFNFKSSKMLSIKNIPFRQLSNYMQRFIYGNNVDFVLGGAINNKSQQRIQTTTVSNFSNVIFRDFIVLRNFNITNDSFFQNFDKIRTSPKYKTINNLFYIPLID